MKTFGKTLLALSLAGALTGVVQADEKVLHVYNWSDYIAEDTLANFEKETGIKVVYDVFDSNETLEAKLLAGSSGYDIVVPSNPFLAKQIKAGVFQKLDKSKLPNWSNLDKSLLKALDPSDPGNQYSIPYMWGTIGIGYNVDKVKAALGDNAPVNSWDLVFKPENIAKLKSCGVSFLDSPTEILPAALNYLGFKPDSTNADELKKAEELFLSIRSSTAYFHSSKYISDLANGDICVAIGYSGDLYQSKSRAEEAKNGVNISYSIPKEGAGSFFDMMAIPADAKNVEAAHVFLNYLMKPEVMANITNFVQFPNGNAAATPLVDEALRNDPGIYPDAATMAKIYTFPDLPANAQRAMTRSWTKIKSGR
ncbi:putrescine transport system substrate-binding protein [Pseudomonas cuatrocienegasensis]|uniref:Putrescine transport system substrate-binding protein n=1 Tax=Pseudomonas cuatrocienegasensis TaxID=543360 RepID=A0ABY1BNJ6_9PSED|nr:MULTISPECIES: polyamine ABC transporter substrate-binding protein [Pseudomonas]OEC33702.1 spermidine/putrescine ABC transporter substrate-binding protein PotF [Pseudomonas sp. 21C1]SER25415.1 putrescine transport system substrate-binding protein [Pseudomonas cuatrocienegasensis]